MDFSADNTLAYIALGLTALYLIARIVMGFRLRIRKPGAKKLPEAEAALLQVEALDLAGVMDAAAARARTLAEETRDSPAEALDIGHLDFTIPGRFRGEVRRLEKLPPPHGPLAALAARKAQTLQQRLHDPNWEAAQRREGLDTPAIYRRLAKDFETAATQARRVETLAQEEGLSSFRQRVAAKRRT